LSGVSSSDLRDPYQVVAASVAGLSSASQAFASRWLASLQYSWGLRRQQTVLAHVGAQPLDAAIALDVSPLLAEQPAYVRSHASVPAYAELPSHPGNKLVFMDLGPDICSTYLFLLSLCCNECFRLGCR